ncbi:hypothetical protein G6F56_014567 [Rhizopus delemar]|nr:hypothetical protein G6F56_014567 [Rhizopus delemar]
MLHACIHQPHRQQDRAGQPAGSQQRGLRQQYAQYAQRHGTEQINGPATITVAYTVLTAAPGWSITRSLPTAVAMMPAISKACT